MSLTQKESLTLAKLKKIKVNGKTRKFVPNRAYSSRGCKSRLLIDLEIPAVVSEHKSHREARSALVNYRASLNNMVIAWEFGDDQPLVLAEIY